MVKGEVSVGKGGEYRQNGGSMEGDEMVLNATSLCLCAEGTVVLWSRRDAG